MALVLADRVQETCTSPGTGAVSLLGALTGFKTFSSSIGNGNTCYYTIADQNGGNWEVGIGTYTSSGNTLTRTTPISGSAATPVNFSSGSQNVFVTYPAEKAVYLDASNIVLVPTLNLTNALTPAYGGTGLTAVGTAGNSIVSNGTVFVSSNAPRAFSYVMSILNGL